MSNTYFLHWSTSIWAKYLNFFFVVTEKTPKEMISISEWTGKHQFSGQNTQQTRLLLIFFTKMRVPFLFILHLVRIQVIVILSSYDYVDIVSYNEQYV